MATNQADIIDHTLKMVVHLRHEFGRSIDIMAMIKDQAYARLIVDLAACSDNARLRQQAHDLASMIWRGSREGTETLGQDAAAGLASGAAGKDADTVSTARLVKYQRGLR